MFIDLIQTTALLLALSLLQGHCSRLLGARPRLAEIASGIVFGGVCVVGMMIPITLAPGVIVDGRSVVLSMAGLFGGGVVGGIGTLIAAVYRGWLGGSGVFIGISAIVVAMLLGLSYRALSQRGLVSRGPVALFIFGVIVHALSILMISTVPGQTLAAVYANLGLTYLLVMGAATALLGLLLADLEHRAQTELALAKREAHLHAITNAIPDILFVIDDKGRYLEAKTHDESLLYRDISGLIGRTLHEVLPTALAARLLPEIQEAIANDRPRTVEYTLDTPSGQRTFEARIQAIDPQGHEPRAVVFIAQDITERVMLEQERRIAAIAFESQQGMLVTDAETRILRVNRAFTEVTGYPAEEVIGKRTNMLSSGRHNTAFYRDLWEQLTANNLWEGEIWNRRRNGEEYPERLAISAVRNAAGVVTHYIGNFTDITLSKASEAEIHTLAYYDHLTGLPNRRMLTDRLRQALALSDRSHSRGALMFIDLDDFKNINDVHGHHAGDALLQQAATRLQAVVRESDTVARFGGDEFVILLEHLSNDEVSAATAAEQIAEKVLSAFAQPFLLAKQEHKCTASIGIAMFNDHHQTVDELMQSADLSMYESKRQGKNQLHFFDPVMQRTVTERLQLEADLRRSLANNELELHYQIQCDAQGKVRGAEALARWRHPLRGLVPPTTFIPVAERCGLMPALGSHLLELACTRLGQWAHDPLRSTLRLSVNVSAVQLYAPHFVAETRSLLERTGCPPDRLVLELTESILLGDIEQAIQTMEALRTLGIRFSIDDFGTGYSSLAYLQRLPLDELKIDRSFVQDLPHTAESLAIVKTIVALARTLDIRIIAEGVEEQEQLDALIANGCDVFQGYFFSRPLAPDAFDAHLCATAAQARTAAS